MGSVEQGLSSAQKEIVKSTVPILKQHGETITATFYKNLLNDNKELRNTFNLSNQFNSAQPKALAGAVLAYASHIDNPGVLMPTIERIAQKHVSMVVTPEQYDVVGQYLVAAFGEVLGDALTEDVVDAWKAAYGQLASIFIQREAALYKQADEWQGWRKFKIIKREVESSSITSFYLAPSDGQVPLPRFRPGQYISLRIRIPQLDNIFQIRQYSMSSAPKDDFYRVSVKKELAPTGADPEKARGLVSNLLHDQHHVGDEIELTYPRGEFWIDVEDSSRSAAPLVLLSAGVGITPLVSILDTVLESPASQMKNRPVLWAHMARSRKELAFGDHIKDIGNQYKHVKSIIHLKNVVEGDEKGTHFDVEGPLLLEDALKESAMDIKNTQPDFFVCGPASWMVAIRDDLQTMGVPAERIQLELFGTGEPDAQPKGAGGA